MDFTLLFVGLGVLYVVSRKQTSTSNTGGKPRTNAFGSGKDYAMSLYNVDTSNGFISTKAIGRIGTPKLLVRDRVGVLHAVHPTDGNVAHCDCRKDAPAH